MQNAELQKMTDTRKGFVRVARSQRVLEVKYATQQGRAVFEGDIILGTAAELAATVNQTDEEGDVVIDAGSLWWQGIVPYVIAADLAEAQRVDDAIAHWHSVTNIRFVPRDPTIHRDYICFQPGDGCDSQIGRYGGEQIITLGVECTAGNVIHELGHTVGLWHEQSRSDRDCFIKIHPENIMPGMEFNFTQHIIDGDDVGAYDYDSVMHYPADAFARDKAATIEVPPGIEIGQRLRLSAGDIAAVQALYPQLKPLP